MNSLKNLADVFALAGGILLLLIVLVTTTNATAFILDQGARLFDANVPALPGYEDFVSLAISCAALMLFPLCQVKRGHVAVDLFTARFPARLNYLIDGLWLAFMAAVIFFLAWWMVIGLLQQMEDDAVKGVLGWAIWPFYIPGIASLLLWGAIAAFQIFERDRYHVT